jgi:hypothetical protein
MEPSVTTTCADRFLPCIRCAKCAYLAYPTRGKLKLRAAMTVHICALCCDYAVRTAAATWCALERLHSGCSGLSVGLPAPPRDAIARIKQRRPLLAVLRACAQFTAAGFHSAVTSDRFRTWADMELTSGTRLPRRFLCWPAPAAKQCMVTVADKTAAHGRG